MIPERVSFQNEFRSGMKFMLHLHEKLNRLIPYKTFSLHIKNKDGASFTGNAPVSINGHICNFS